MNYRLIFTGHYQKTEKRFLKKHPDLIDRYHRVLRILEQDPFHPSLRLHSLRGKLTGLHSISITMQYRLTLELLMDKHDVIPVAIGSHREVY